MLSAVPQESMTISSWSDLYLLCIAGSSGGVSSSQARERVLGLPGRHTTASTKHSTKKQSKRGRAGPRRAQGHVDSASLTSDAWLLSASPSKGSNIRSRCCHAHADTHAHVECSVLCLFLLGLQPQPILQFNACTLHKAFSTASSGSRNSWARLKATGFNSCQYNLAAFVSRVWERNSCRSNEPQHVLHRRNPAYAQCCACTQDQDWGLRAVGRGLNGWTPPGLMMCLLRR